LEFTIRRCHGGDKRALSLLGAASFLETYAGNAEATDILAHVDAEHSTEKYGHWLASDFAHIWVVETAVGRSPIGYAVALTSQDAGSSTEMEIRRLYLLYRFHRKGLGQRLMDEILAAARQSRVAALFLKAYEPSQNSVGFYLRNGFRVVGEEPFRAGERDYQVLVMRLVL